MAKCELVEGNAPYKEGYHKENEAKFIDLVENGQHPDSLYIGCSDSRVLPNLITNSGPGDLFVTRNIGNLVPVYNTESADFHAVAPVIEYAVAALKIKHIIVCGHTQCGAMAALHGLEGIEDSELVHTKQWLTQALDTRTKAIAQHGDNKDKEALLRLTEKLSVVKQMENLLTYPSVKKRVDSGEITLHGWHYDIKTGNVEVYNSETSQFS